MLHDANGKYYDCTAVETMTQKYPGIQDTSVSNVLRDSSNLCQRGNIEIEFVHGDKSVRWFSS